MRYRDFYEAYQIKYKKNKKILKIAIIVASCILVVIGAFLGLYFASGTVTDYGALEASYGDSIASPSAFLGNAWREYEVDKEWTSDMPDVPGTYSSRIVSKSIFGRITITDTNDFTIGKRNTSIYCNMKTVTYGENPTVFANLYGTDVLSSYSLVYDSMILAETKVSVLKESVVILNEEGLDVTSFYEIDTPKSDITFTEAPLTIILKDKEKTYDGTPLTSSDYEVQGTLYNGDYIDDVTTKGSQTYAGTSLNEITSFKIYSKDHEEVTNYRVNVVHGNLTVNPLTVNLTTEDKTVTFDGEEQEFSSYSLDKEIPDEIKVNPLSLYEAGSYEYALTLQFEDLNVSSSYDFTYSYGTVTVMPSELEIKIQDVTDEYSAVTEYDAEYEVTDGSLYGARLTLDAKASMESWNLGSLNAQDYCIINPEGKDITSSFDIHVTAGVITRTPRAIEIEPAVKKKEYDGKEYSSVRYTILNGSLVEEDTVSVIFSTSEIFPGSYQFEVSSCIFKDKEETDITERYSITFKNLDFEITKKKITIIPIGDDVEYGCNPVVDYTLSEGSLAEGDEVSTIPDEAYFFNETETNLKNATIGNNKLTLDASYISILHDGEDYTEYYDITVSEGTIKVTPRALAISIMSKSIIYTGEAVTFEDSDMYVYAGTLAYSDAIAFHLSQTYSITDYSAKGLRTSLSLEDVSITDGDADKTGCYNITFLDGTIMILKRDLTFTTGSVTKVYDYSTLTCKEFEASGLADTDSVDLTNTLFSGSLSYVGSTSNTVDVIKIVRGSTDATANYNITVVEGTLTYLPKED